MLTSSITLFRLSLPILTLTLTSFRWRRVTTNSRSSVTTAPPTATKPTLISTTTTTTSPPPRTYSPPRRLHMNAPPPLRPTQDAALQDSGERYSDDAFISQPMAIATFETQSDPNRSRVSSARNEKRSDCEDLSDEGTPYSYNKKAKITGSSSGGAGDYRRDREEWSDTAISFLLDAYLEKFMQLNRGNLRVRDWEEVAGVVSERCENQLKNVEQCKNKVDNLKKRYKLERHRVMNSNGGNTTSHWPWYQKMEQIVGNSLPLKAVLDEDKSIGGINSSGRQSKRYKTTPCSPSGQITNMELKSVTNPRWRRVVFKISGSAFSGTGSENIDPKVAMLIAREVSIACHIGIEVAIVIGGRNLFCGDTWVTENGLDRSTAYQIGMIATVMNSILLQSALEKLDVEARVQSAFCMPEVSEPYNKQRAIRHLEKGRVVIFGGIGTGSGNPLFSTDTAAALRASEIHADAVIKGTSLHGIYECATINSGAYEHISFRECVSRGVLPMDMMAVTFCEENEIPVVLFNLHEPGNITRALSGEHIGTLVDLTGRVG